MQPGRYLKNIPILSLTFAVVVIATLCRCSGRWARSLQGWQEPRPGCSGLGWSSGAKLSPPSFSHPK